MTTALDKIEEELQSLYERIRDDAFYPDGDHQLLDAQYRAFCEFISSYKVTDFSPTILAKIIVVAKMFVEIEELNPVLWYA